MKLLSEFKCYDEIKVLFLDFDGVFTNNNVTIDETGMEYVTCSRYDGFGISHLKQRGIEVIVLSTEKKMLASKRCDKLGIDCYQSLDDKLSFAEDFIAKSSLTFSQVGFMGNDINDLQLLRSVRLPVVTCDCHSSVASPLFYRTSLPGGSGCIRELADYFR
jgi:3-deoxy-D-manno-octulosonate 8-phosphate phosphatase (KDO 8-P phosphatase)